MNKEGILKDALRQAKLPGKAQTRATTQKKAEIS